MGYKTSITLTVALAGWLAVLTVAPGWAAEGSETQQIAILQIKVTEGEGAVHTAGSRSSRPITIQVTDEIGKPVEGVTVSLQMPTTGPRGDFLNGLQTEVLVTGPEGQVSAWGIKWERTPGPVKIRITAVKGSVRAGTVSEQYIVASGQSSQDVANPQQPSVSKPRGKWIAIALVAAGATAGGLVLGLSGSSTASQPIAAAASQTKAVQVGLPTITVGGP